MTDVELSDAAPTPAPEPLTAEQGEELVAAIDEIRKANRNVTRRLHGWTLEWKTRPRGTQRGDLCAIDPRDGQKLFSTASVQRKLLSGSSAAPPSDDAPKDDDDPSASAAKGSRVPRAVSQLNSQLVLDAPEASDGGRRPSRSTRTVVNYAELNTVSPRMPDQILKALDRLDPEKTLGADLVDLADGVHTLGDLVLEETRPFAAVQRTLVSMLRQGMLRRRLAPMTNASPSGPMTVEGALSLLVLATLQVEPEADNAPWRWVEASEVAEPEPSATEMKVEDAEAEEEEEAAEEKVEEAAEEAAEEEEAEEEVKEEAAKAEETVVAPEAAGSSDGTGDCPAGEWGAVRARLRGDTLDASAAWSAPPRMSDEEWAASLAAEESAAAAEAEARGEEPWVEEEDDPYVWHDDSEDDDYSDDELPPHKRGRGARGAAKGGGAAGAGGSGDGVLRPRVEGMLSLPQLKDRLPINTDPACFGCPTGWEEGRVENGRRPKKIWTRRAPAEPDDGDGVSGGGGGMSDDGRGVEEGVSELTVMERRIELEALLEREAAEAGKPYLGHVIGGAWQISSKAITSALMHVLSGLVAIGRLKELPPKLTGKASVCWIASNTYVRGEPFPREPKAASGKRKKDDDADDDEPEEEEQLADIELERLRNIERNREILRQLGLA